jgi:hypothetical protein
MMTTSRLLRFAAVGMVTCLLTFPASAEQRPTEPASDTLPGVEDGYSIVTPAPEPLEAPSEGGGYTLKAGNTDIRISGSVSVEIGFGSQPPGNEYR